MPTKPTGLPRRQRNDTAKAALDAARMDDMSAAAFPPVTGWDHVPEVGKQAVEALYRENPQRYTIADLMLLVEVGTVVAGLHELKTEHPTPPQLVPNRFGQLTPNPVVDHMRKTQRALQDLLRSLGIRGRDGAVANPVVNPMAVVSSSDAQSASVFSLETALSDKTGLRRAGRLRSLAG